MANKKFVLCVGVPKAGTTWLYRCLQDHPEVNWGHKKEYHAFDTHFYPGLQSYRALIPAGGDMTNLFYQKFLAAKQLDQLLQVNHDRYGEFFADILRDPRVMITGDFTPTYCVLRDPEFRYIQSLTKRHGLDTHIIYLVRDPVERIVSYVKMLFKFKEYHGQKLPLDISFDDLLEQIAFSQLNVDITDYKNTIQSLLANFDDSKIHFGVYETMHTFNEMNRLSDFLGVSIEASWANKKINANLPSNFEVSDYLREKIKMKFANQFLFCQDFFIDQNISSVWRNYP